MTTFHGPWASDLKSLQKHLQSIPSTYKSTLDDTSKSTLEKLCSPNALHVWVSDSDIDSLLQITAVIAKLSNLGTRKDKNPTPSDGVMVVIAEEQPEVNHFLRICQVVSHLTSFGCKKYLDGNVCVYGSIVVAKGCPILQRADDSHARAMVSETIKRINVCLERALAMSKGIKKIVWHNGPTLSFLLAWIDGTTPQLRGALTAVSVTNCITFVTSVGPSHAGRYNKPADIQRLESYAERLHIPVLFLDAASLLLTITDPASYIYYYPYYVHILLPATVLRAHVDKAQDELVCFAFKINGGKKGVYGRQVVQKVKSELSYKIALRWAMKCLDAREYEKTACQAAVHDSAMEHITKMANVPISLLAYSSSDPARGASDTLHAFTRLPIGPCAPIPSNFSALPISFSFSAPESAYSPKSAAARLRISHPSSLFILTPAPEADISRIAAQIQGTLLAVIERVRQEKGTPDHIGDEGLRNEWREVGRVCRAMLGNGSGVPENVMEKVKQVAGKAGKGAWGTVIGEGTGSGNGGVSGVWAEGISDAAKANRAAEQAYNSAHMLGRQMYNSQQSSWHQQYAGQQAANTGGSWSPQGFSGSHDIRGSISPPKTPGRRYTYSDTPPRELPRTRSFSRSRAASTSRPKTPKSSRRYPDTPPRSDPAWPRTQQPHQGGSRVYFP